MPKTLLASWWGRRRGRLEPALCPFSNASVLDMPLRKLVASPKRVLDAFGLANGGRVLEVSDRVSATTPWRRRDASGPLGRLICLDLQREMLAETHLRVAAAGLLADCVQADAIPGCHCARTQSTMHSSSACSASIRIRPSGLADIDRVLRAQGRLSVSEQLPDPDFVTKGTLRKELSAAGFADESTRGLLCTRRHGGADQVSHQRS